MININDLTLVYLERELQSIGQPKYRAGQIFKWFARGVFCFDEMSDLSKSLREELSHRYKVADVIIEKEFFSKHDETSKYLINLNDGNLIECVAMKYHHGITLCLSTQAGCRMGCRFCASALDGRIRNLTPGEILGQAALLQKKLGQRISNIVLMGMGEPLDNYENVLTFLENVNNKRGMNIGYRHISLSTCGIADKICRLAKEGMPITLSVSLHAPNDEIRNILMPVNKKYPVASVIDACREYIKITGRRITFEYILIQNINDSPLQAGELARLLDGMLCHVNLIPANLVPESGFVGSSPKRAADFLMALKKHQINATLRRRLGSDIEASCGQLRRRHGI
jgi:23S rRNA (adenine2503-C2)-methyltransferase